MNARPSRRARHSRGGLPAGAKYALFGLALALGAFVVGYGISALSFSAGADPTDVVLVPDVRTLAIDEARSTMSRAGLGIEVGDSFPNPDVPAGAVLAQSPLPGQEVSPGVPVRLILSTGRLRPTVPAVDAMPVSLATRALRTAGFDVMVEPDTFPGDAGRVVGVDPAAGTPVELPATVSLRIGGGFHIIEMPTLVGMSDRDAFALIEDLGLEVGRVSYVEDGPAGAIGVVEQSPLPGDSVATGSFVNVRIVSSGFDFRNRRDGLDFRGDGAQDRDLDRNLGDDGRNRDIADPASGDDSGADADDQRRDRDDDDRDDDDSDDDVDRRRFRGTLGAITNPTEDAGGQR